jgi:hypothetical protein
MMHEAQALLSALFKKNFFLKSWVQWLIPIILATWNQRLGGLQFKASLSKKFMRLLLNLRLGMVAHICHPSYYGMYKVGDPSLGQPGYKVRPKLKKKKKNQSKKGWQSGSSGRVPAWQRQGPEFNLQYSQKERTGGRKEEKEVT